MSLRVFCPRAHMCATPGNRCIGCIFHPGSGPRGWGPTGRVPGFAITVPLVRPRRAEARCSVPGPHPAEKGAVITRPRGAPHTHTREPFIPGHARPQPRRLLPSPARSLVLVREDPAGGQRTRDGEVEASPVIVSIATPSSGVGCRVSPRSGLTELAF